MTQHNAQLLVVKEWQQQQQQHQPLPMTCQRTKKRTSDECMKDNRQAPSGWQGRKKEEEELMPQLYYNIRKYKAQVED